MVRSGVGVVYRCIFMYTTVQIMCFWQESSTEKMCSSILPWGRPSAPDRLKTNRIGYKNVCEECMHLLLTPAMPVATERASWGAKNGVPVSIGPQSPKPSLGPALCTDLLELQGTVSPLWFVHKARIVRETRRSLWEYD